MLLDLEMSFKSYLLLLHNKILVGQSKVRLQYPGSQGKQGDPRILFQSFVVANGCTQLGFPGNCIQLHWFHTYFAPYRSHTLATIMSGLPSFSFDNFGHPKDKTIHAPVCLILGWSSTEEWAHGHWQRAHQFHVPHCRAPLGTFLWTCPIERGTLPAGAPTQKKVLVVPSAKCTT